MEDQQKFKMECLARHILREYQTVQKRREFLDRWEKRNGSESRREVEHYLEIEFYKRRDEHEANKQHFDDQMKLIGLMAEQK